MTIPSSQNFPLNPGRQEQYPKAGSQVELFWQVQLPLHLNPYVPWGQAVNTKKRNLTITFSFVTAI